MEEAVQAYQKTHDGEAPIVNSTVISVNGSNVLESEDYYAIAVCRLLGSTSSGDIMKNLIYVTHSRNCVAEGANAEPYATNCLNQCTGSYVWLTTINGNIASICMGDECTAHGEDGFQDVWP